MPWRKGISGNPSGRPLAARNKRTVEAIEIFEKYNFSPLRSKILLARRLENKLHRNHFGSPEETLAYIAQYSDILKDLLQYYMPKLKQVDHFAHIEIIERLQSVDQYSDAEIAALLDEARELISGPA